MARDTDTIEHTRHRTKTKLETPWTEPASLTCHFVLRKLYTEPSISAFYQISINWAKWFYRRFFLIGQSQTRTVYAGHISCTIGSKNGYFVHDLSYIIPTKNQFIVRPGSRGEIQVFF